MAYNTIAVIDAMWEQAGKMTKNKAQGKTSIQELGHRSKGNTQEGKENV